MRFLRSPAGWQTHIRPLVASMNELYWQMQYGCDHCHDRCVTLPRECGRGHFRSVCPRKGMLLFLEEYRLGKEMSITSGNIASKTATLPIGISYCLSGAVNWTMDGRREEFTTRRGHCELVFAGNTNGIMTYGSAEPVVIVNIMLCPRLLQSYFSEPFDGSAHAVFQRLSAVEKDFLYRKHKIPGAVHPILKQLLRRPLQNMADALFIQGKVMELIAIHLDQLDATDRKRTATRTKAAEGQIVSRAKAVLRDRMQSPPTVHRLARMVGTNETTLKRSFSAHCGATVYGYLTDLRMQRACELLQDDSLTMSRIGAELGYSERTHFSRAFSRYYGIPPSQYRRKNGGHP